MQIADQIAGGEIEPEELKLFFSSIKSEQTRIKYKIYFKKYLKLTGLTVNEIVSEKNPRVIERQIIDFIIKMKDEGKNYPTIHNYKSMILAFYKINDIVLNLVKINKFMPEQRRAKKDYKLTVYEGFKEEYFTFITPECKQAIEIYLDMRSRYGEKIEDECYLIREQFDVKDSLAIGKCRSIARGTIQWKLREIAKRSNVRSNQVPNAHGFRKFYTTQLINSKVNPEIREMLLSHKIGLASAYYRPTEQEMFNEYQKAINNLTIDPSNRLRIEVDTLKREKTSYEFLNSKIDSLQNHFVEIFDNIAKNKDTLNSVPIEEFLNFLKKRQEIDQ